MSSNDKKDSTKGLSRRFILRGLGGAALAIPVLPSLLTASEARAQAAQNQKNYIHFFTEHGSVWGANMFPADNAVAETTNVAGRQVRRTVLAPSVANGVAKLSEALSAPSTLLTAAMAAKMNVLRGLDIPFGIAHYRGGTLGNYAANNGDNSLAAQIKSSQPRRTIDQVMAWAPEFYGSAAGISQRSVTIAVPDPYANAHLSYGYSNPAAGSGSITHIQGVLDSWTLFGRLFPGAGTTPSTRPPIVDNVFEQYKALRNGNKRLSLADQQRLDEYIQRVSEIQRRLGTAFVSCTDVTRSSTNNTSLLNKSGFDTNPTDHARYAELLTDIIIAALQCGRTRIASLGLLQSYSSEVSSALWHDGVAHPAQDDTTAQRRMVDARRSFFANVMLPFVTKMDAIQMGDGKTLLDKSMVVWAQEHGNLTHQTTSIPIITFGGADGALRTGNYCDYRDMPRLPKLYGAGGEFAVERYGLVLNQFFGNVLQIMGVPRSAYQEANHNGYGYRPASNMSLGDTNNTVSSGSAYPEAVWATAGNMLPWLGS